MSTQKKKWILFLSLQYSRDNNFETAWGIFGVINAKVTTEFTSKPLPSHSLIKGLFCVYICCYTVHTKYLLLLKLAIPARLRKLLIRSAFKTQSQISHFVKYKMAGHCSSLVESLLVQWSFTTSKKCKIHWYRKPCSPVFYWS